MHQNPEPTVWVLTDGKAGDEGQCIGVAERLGVVPEIRRVKPRKPWSRRLVAFSQRAKWYRARASN